MSWGTVGLVGQVFDGPWCYVDSWDLTFQREVGRIASLGTRALRARALDEIEAAAGVESRRRMEAALKRLWAGRSGR